MFDEGRVSPYERPEYRERPGDDRGLPFGDAVEIAHGS